MIENLIFRQSYSILSFFVFAYTLVQFLYLFNIQAVGEDQRLTSFAVAVSSCLRLEVVDELEAQVLFAFVLFVFLLELLYGFHLFADLSLQLFGGHFKLGALLSLKGDAEMLLPFYLIYSLLEALLQLRSNFR